MTVTRADVVNRIGVRMDTLEWLLKHNYHLKDPVFFEDVLEACVKYWQELNESDREFYEAARWALENNKPWQVGNP